MYADVTSGTVGEYLSKRKQAAERAYNARVARADQAHASEVRGITVAAHRELAAVDHAVASAQSRTASLLSAGLDLGDRAMPAKMLHSHLTDAVAAAGK